MRRCANCGTGRIAAKTVKRKRHVAGHVFAGDLPARVCEECGTSYFDDREVGQFDALVAAKLAEAAERRRQTHGLWLSSNLTSM